MDKEDRWDLYIDERLDREEQKLESVNPLVEEFVEFLEEEEITRVLDMGCGLGRHMHYLFQKKFNAIGCDISPKTLELAEKFAGSKGLKLDFVQCDFTDLPFNSEVFGGVIAIDTIHHDFLENILKALREIHRVLAPDGYVCLNPISTGDELFGQGRKLGDRLFVIHRVPHYFFDSDEIEYVLDRMFFKPVKMSKITFKQVRDGEELKREHFNIIARKIARRRSHFGPLLRSL